MSDAHIPVPQVEQAVTGAKLLVGLLALAWGFTWVSIALALPYVSPWTLRFAASAIGAVTLFAAAILTRHDLRLPRGEIIHVAIAGLLNVTLFQILSAFAQLHGATSRVVIVNYSMPIWSVLLARVVLGERLNKTRGIALVLCAIGLVVLIAPLVQDGVPVSMLYALGSALCWSLATVYIKWAKLTIEPLVNAVWQLFSGAILLGVGALLYGGRLQFTNLNMQASLAILYVGVIGVGLAHFLWWTIVGKLPTATASLGVLLVPVIGVVSSMIILGEQPTVTDLLGFASIFAAAACVLLQPNTQLTELQE